MVGRAHECCDGFDKIFHMEACESQLSSGVGCPYKCISREMGLLRNEKFNLETALNSSTFAAGDDTLWIAVSIKD